MSKRYRSVSVAVLWIMQAAAAFSMSTGETMVSTTTTAEQAAIETARAALARKLNIGTDRLEVLSVEQRTWKNSGLGCSPPDAKTLQMVTEGYAVVLRAPDGSHQVHVAGRQAAICNPAAIPSAPRLASSAHNLPELLAKARADLAGRLGVPEEEVRVERFTPVRWRDSAMECPIPGEATEPRPTRGYRLELSYGGRSFTYHTDMKQARACPPIEAR